MFIMTNPIFAMSSVNGNLYCISAKVQFLTLRMDVGEVLGSLAVVVVPFFTIYKMDSFNTKQNAIQYSI